MNTTPMRKLRRCLVPVAGVLLLIAGCGDAIPPGTTAGKAQAVKAPVTQARLETRDLEYEAAGTVRATDAGTVAAKIMGTIQALHVTEGDRVKAGDLLVTIDERQVKAGQNQAAAALAAARKAEDSALAALKAAAAGAELARATEQRYGQLLQDQSVTRQERDEVTARARQAEAGLAQARAMAEAARHQAEQAEAGLAAARVAGADAKVVAPYDGVVTARLAEVGDLAAPGRPLLTLVRTGGLRVDVTVPETHAGAVAVGAKVRVRVDALDNNALNATVSAVAPASDPASRSFLVKVDLPGTQAVQPGMFARVYLPVGKDEVLLVPSTAVVHQGQLTGVLVVDKEAIARLRLIRTGRLFGETVEVLSGLAAAERIVAKVAPGLADGVRVEVAP